MKSKQAEIDKTDAANTNNILHDTAAAARAADVGMAGAGAGPWSRRARCLSALAALLGYLLLLAYLELQYMQVRHLNRLLDFEKDSDELLKNLELLDHEMGSRLERLAALQRPP